MSFLYSDAILAIQINLAKLSSGSQIPIQYTCDGANLAPIVSAKQLPHGAKSLVFILQDPYAPSPPFIHWIVWNLPAKNQRFSAKALPVGAIMGKNSLGIQGYTGPCPPIREIHHYQAVIYALSITFSPGLAPLTHQN